MDPLDASVYDPATDPDMIDPEDDVVFSTDAEDEAAGFLVDEYPVDVVPWGDVTESE